MFYFLALICESLASPGDQNAVNEESSRYLHITFDCCDDVPAAPPNAICFRPLSAALAIRSGAPREFR